MSERFEFPWTVGAVPDGTSSTGHRQAEVVLAGDVPGIVKAEVERALQWSAATGPRVDGPEEVAAYLAARFGAAPETPSEPCGKPGCRDPRCQPTGTAVLNERLTLRPEGKVIPAVPVVFTEAERDTLHRLERFCAALAKQQLDEYGWVAGREGVDPAYEMLKVAREFLGGIK